MNIPAGWKKVKFGELAKQKSVRVDNPGESGFKKYVGLEHLDSGQLVVKRWGSTQDVKSAMKLFNENDILFARRNTYLRRVSVANFDGVCSGDIIVIEPILNEIIKGFLPIFMQFESFENRVISLSAGAFSKRIKWNQLADENILIPSKKEQKKMVDLIWAIEDNIEKTENLIAINEKLKKGLLNKLLTKGIGHKKFKKTEIGEIPEDWRVVTIDKVTECLDNLRKPITKSKREKGEIPYYGATGKVDSIKEYIFDEVLLLIGEDCADFKSFGNTAYIINGKSWVNNHIHVLRCKLININFLKEVINYSDLTKYISGTTRQKLTKGNLVKIKIPSPPDVEQEKIANLFNKVDLELESSLSNLTILNNLKKKLTDDILRGEVKV